MENKDKCVNCGKELGWDEGVWLHDGSVLCVPCADELTVECDHCGDYEWDNMMQRCRDRDGRRIWVCDGCFEEYYQSRCQLCEEHYHPDVPFTTVRDYCGAEYECCPSCASKYPAPCARCGVRDECAGYYGNEWICSVCLIDIKEQEQEQEQRKKYELL